MSELTKRISLRISSVSVPVICSGPVEVQNNCQSISNFTSLTLQKYIESTVHEINLTCTGLDYINH